MKNAEGRWVISSAAFSPSSSDKSLSIDHEQLLVEDGLATTDLYPGIERSVGLYALSIRELTALKLDTDHRPLWSNWYHGGVQNITHGHRRKLAKQAVPVVEIDQTAAAAFQTVGEAIES